MSYLPSKWGNQFLYLVERVGTQNQNRIHVSGNGKPHGVFGRVLGHLRTRKIWHIEDGRAASAAEHLQEKRGFC